MVVLPVQHGLVLTHRVSDAFGVFPVGEDHGDFDTDDTPGIRAVPVALLFGIQHEASLRTAVHDKVAAEPASPCYFESGTPQGGVT